MSKAACELTTMLKFTSLTLDFNLKSLLEDEIL